jgi:hypothetical protein
MAKKTKYQPLLKQNIVSWDFNNEVNSVLVNQLITNNLNQYVFGSNIKDIAYEGGKVIEWELSMSKAAGGTDSPFNISLMYGVNASNSDAFLNTINLGSFTNTSSEFLIKVKAVFLSNQIYLDYTVEGQKAIVGTLSFTYRQAICSLPTYNANGFFGFVVNKGNIGNVSVRNLTIKKYLK